MVVVVVVIVAVAVGCGGGCHGRLSWLVSFLGFCFVFFTGFDGHGGVVVVQ